MLVNFIFNLKMIKEVEIRNFRSIEHMVFAFSKSRLDIVCGENNIGKSNFLRALNLFFNYGSVKYSRRNDMPYHIVYGSRSGTAGTYIKITFSKEEGICFSLSMLIRKSGIEYRKNNETITRQDFEENLSSYKYYYIQSNNPDIPRLIATALDEQGLLPLKKSSNGSKAMRALQNFLSLAKQELSEIEYELNKVFENYVNVDGILKGKKVTITFSEYENLSEALRNLIKLTIDDGNNLSVDFKGSGVQRILLLSLIQFIANKNFEEKNVIFAIDEPEIFLQSKLQRAVFSELKKLTERDNRRVLIATHSSNFIDLSNLNSINLFSSENELRSYRKGEQKREIYVTKTLNQIFLNDYQKISAIKLHMGLQENDGWRVLPHNVLVEGEDDEKYINKLINSIGSPSVNIIWSGGASKISSYLMFYDSFSINLNFRPKFICIFDEDEEGISQRNKINKKHYKNIDIELINLEDSQGRKISANKEIEDFLPINVLMNSVNSFLSKEGYNPITKKQVEDKSKEAHKSKPILQYITECCSINNPDLARIDFENSGRKLQLCTIFCGMSNDDILNSLTESQKKFINKIIGN